MQTSHYHGTLSELFCYFSHAADSVNIKILNAGAWSRSSEKVFVSLPTELEDLIPEVEDFYKRNHSGRKLHWHHLMSNGIVSKLHKAFPVPKIVRNQNVMVSGKYSSFTAGMWKLLG